MHSTCASLLSTDRSTEKLSCAVTVTHTRHLVGADRDPQTGAADQQRAVGLAGRDPTGRLDGDVRVCSVLVGAHTDVNYLRDPRVSFEVSLQNVLVLQACVVAAYDDAPLVLGHL